MKATGSGLVCDGCGEETAVVDSRAAPDGIRRRRRCIGCGKRYTTLEVRVEDAATLVRSQRLLAAFDSLTVGRRALMQSLLVELAEVS